jgi:hypothetical protein
MYGTEYYWQFVNSPRPGDPMFQGGEIFASWFFTGETRGLQHLWRLLQGISPRKTVFEGGPGALEAVVRLSHSDFNNQGVEGGEFWRITPQLSWYLTDYSRIEFIYGYACWTSSAFNGTTQFLQTAIRSISDARALPALEAGSSSGQGKCDVSGAKRSLAQSRIAPRVRRAATFMDQRGSRFYGPTARFRRRPRHTSLE